MIPRAPAASALALLAAAAGAAATDPVPTPPRSAAGAKPKAIVMMLIDDLGFWDTAVQNPLAPTPHLGQMKSEGIVLDQMYVPALSHLARSTHISGPGTSTATVARRAARCSRGAFPCTSPGSSPPSAAITCRWRWI